MAGRLTDKIALITGGGSGIGRACALRFAAEGAKVCVADLDLAAATETARRLETAGSKSLAMRTDTTDEAANDAMVAACVKAFGVVDILVAAAGVGSPRPPEADVARSYTMLTIPRSGSAR
jgi:NAD(P)-dependent dehydrogenase (short-subunit alcohol dehydrogenase family)